MKEFLNVQDEKNSMYWSNCYFLAQHAQLLAHYAKKFAAVQLNSTPEVRD